MSDQIRGVAHVPLNGKRTIELLVDYNVPVRLRLKDDAGVDQGALSFRPYDPNSGGNGYLFHLFDHEGGTLLAEGSAQQLGARATSTLTFGTQPSEDDTVTITYPDLSVQTAAPVMITEVYRLRDAGNLAQANDALIGGSLAVTIDNLVKAINGSFDFAAPEVYYGTDPCKELVAYRSGTNLLVLEARDGGTWGNSVTLLTDHGSWTAAAMTGGTGNSGLLLHFDAADLPKTLIASPNIQRIAHAEIFGRGAGDIVVKLASCPADMHASAISPA